MGGIAWRLDTTLTAELQYYLIIWSFPEVAFPKEIGVQPQPIAIIVLASLKSTTTIIRLSESSIPQLKEWRLKSWLENDQIRVQKSDKYRQVQLLPLKHLESREFFLFAYRFHKDSCLLQASVGLPSPLKLANYDCRSK